MLLTANNAAFVCETGRCFEVECAAAGWYAGGGVAQKPRNVNYISKSEDT